MAKILDDDDDNDHDDDNDDDDAYDDNNENDDDRRTTTVTDKGRTTTKKARPTETTRPNTKRDRRRLRKSGQPKPTIQNTKRPNPASNEDQTSRRKLRK